VVELAVGVVLLVVDLLLLCDLIVSFSSLQLTVNPLEFLLICGVLRRLRELLLNKASSSNVDWENL
jgi:hypothetical protein